ncbi:MAG: metallophosphoesterase [Bacteroidota bacterium]
MADNNSQIHGKHFAISDIHGCAYTFLELLNKIDFSKDDTLYILGDMISRGKHSKKVIKSILSMQKEGYSIVPLRGNHEQFVISGFKQKESEDFFITCKRMNLSWLFNKTDYSYKEKYYSFFEHLPFYYTYKNFLLSHAGFDFSQEDFFANKYAMLNQRKTPLASSIPDSTHIVHGHTPTSLKKIERSVIYKLPVINIDNGCVYRNLKDKGSLICVNLDDFELFSQKNID